MTNWKRRTHIVAAAIILAVFSSCGPRTETASQVSESSTPTAEGVTFGDGFYKEELAQGNKIRWVRQVATLRVQVPTEGSYRVTFHPVTAFNKNESVISATVNGQPGGTLTTNTPDFANPPTASITAAFRAGENTITLKSNQPETSFGANDPRRVSFGVVNRVEVQPAQ